MDYDESRELINVLEDIRDELHNKNKILEEINHTLIIIKGRI